jgi:hypothetical protein
VKLMFPMHPLGINVYIELGVKYEKGSESDVSFVLYSMHYISGT